MKDKRISVSYIDANLGRKVLTPNSLVVYRGGLISWIITNVEKSKTLTVGIDNFVPKQSGSPANPVQTSPAVTLGPGAIGVIGGLVNGVGQGQNTRLKYSYNVIIENIVIDPEIVVCDDPGPPFPRGKKKPTKKKPAGKPKKKAVKK